jgi:hypothetical protein
MNQGVAPGINTGIPIGRNGPGIDTSGSPNSRQGPNSGAPLRDPFASLQLATAKAKATSRVKPQAPPKHPPGTPFVLTDYAKYIGTGMKGNGACVALPQTLVDGIGQVSTWRQGDQVRGSKTILPGTVIATFETNGRYMNREHQNHAAIYIAQVTAGVDGETETGIKVLDQWNGNPPHPPHPPQTRVITYLGKYEKEHTFPSAAKTIYKSPSDNGDALFIVVH